MGDESKLLIIEVLKRDYSLSVKCSTINKKKHVGFQTSMDPHIIEIETKFGWSSLFFQTSVQELGVWELISTSLECYKRDFQ